jgi:hypothetical protein
MGIDARKRKIYRVRRRRDGGLRPLNQWERHLLIMDSKGRAEDHEGVQGSVWRGENLNRRGFHRYR